MSANHSPIVTLRQLKTDYIDPLLGNEQMALKYPKAKFKELRTLQPQVTQTCYKYKIVGRIATAFFGSIALYMARVTLSNLYHGRTSIIYNAIIWACYSAITLDSYRITEVISLASDTFSEYCNGLTETNNTPVRGKDDYETAKILKEESIQTIKSLLTTIHHHNQSTFLAPNLTEMNISWLFSTNEQDRRE